MCSNRAWNYSMVFYLFFVSDYHLHFLFLGLVHSITDNEGDALDSFQNLNTSCEDQMETNWKPNGEIKFHTNRAKRSLYWSKRSSNPIQMIRRCNYKNQMHKQNKRGLYWSKRAEYFQTLPFSTIVRNGQRKRGDFLPFSTIIRNSQ